MIVSAKFEADSGVNVTDKVTDDSDAKLSIVGKIVKGPKLKCSSNEFNYEVFSLESLLAWRR